MKNDFAFAVGNATANFISKRNLDSGNVSELISSHVVKGGNVINICFDSGWFSLAGKIKSYLLEHNVINFSLNDNKPFINDLQVLLSSVKEVSTVIVTGSEDLALAVSKFYLNKSVKVIYLPLDFNYEFFLKNSLENANNNLVILDESLLAKCNRSAFADCVRRIFARKIFRVEIAVNRAINQDNNLKQAENQLNESEIYLQKYLDTHLIVYLVIAHLKSIIFESITNIEYLPLVTGEILNKLNANFSLRGEREYLVYKMLLKLYRFYFSNDTSFILKNCGIASQEEELNKLMGDCVLLDYSLPQIVYNENEINSIKQKIVKDINIINLIDNLISELENEAQILKKEFGGKKYTVEHYSTKQRATALTLAPYLIKKDCAYKLLFASGILEYFL